MLQVDLLWVYGIGAMFATCAAKQLKRLVAEKGGAPSSSVMLGNTYFSSLLIYISAIFVPEAIWLLWNFPHWETMHLWLSLEEIPTVLAALFIAGDALLTVLGYWAACKLIVKGKDYLAHLQWVAGYFAFFLVLTHGWDGLAWQRFTWDPTTIFPFKVSLSSTMLTFMTGGGAAWLHPALLALWALSVWMPGKTMAAAFATSNVALTLYAMAAPTLIPLLVGGYIILRDGHKLSGMGEKEASSLAIKGVLTYLVGVLFAFILAGVVTLVSSYITGVSSLPVGFAAGLIVAVIIAYLTAIREESILRKAFTKNFNL